MSKRMLIDATHAEETRVVVLDGNRLEDFDIETSTKRQLKGNIYLAKVVRVEPSLQAAFVEYGGNRHGFLAFSEIHPDYYQIPVADRQRLLELQAEEARLEEEEDDLELALTQASAVDPAPHQAAAADPASGDEDAPPFIDTPAPETWARADQPMLIEPATTDGSPAHLAAVPAAAESWALAAVPALATPDAETISAPEHILVADHDDDQPDASDDHDLFGSIPEEAPPETIGGGHDQPGDDSDPDNGDERTERRFPPRFLRNYHIQEVIHRRQILLVQVVKEERGTKGAALTTYLSLAGRFSVLMPNSPRGGGISRKITSAADRRRLKEVMVELDIPKGMGLIVRTAGAQRPKPEIKRDCEYLLRLWDDIREHTLKSIAPALVYEEASLIKRAIRDVYSRDIDDITVDGEAGWRAAHEFMRMLMPSHARKVIHWPDQGPSLFARFAVEAQLDAMLQPTVQLRSGGYLVINQAEALVAIDVNSGRSTRERNIEETALRTNLEAADEVARQLRLRDLAGLIVIDFIDMESKRHNAMVERRIKDALKDDRARIQLGHISHFGLMEMSRQRLRPSLEDTTLTVCQHCTGIGLVRGTESAALHLLRGVEEAAGKRRSAEVIVHVATPIALYILNHKHERLNEIERRYGMRVIIAADDSLIAPRFRVDRVRTLAPGEGPSFVTADAPRPSLIARPEPDDVDEDDDDDEADEIAPGVAASDETEESREAERGRRRRRKRRRGGREDGPASEGESRADAEDDSVPSVQADRPAPTEAPASVPETEEEAANRRRRGRSRRGRRRDGDGGLSPLGVPGAEQPDLMPVYAGPTPADPFGGQAFDIFDAMEQAELNAAPVRAAQPGRRGTAPNGSPRNPVQRGRSRWQPPSWAVASQPPMLAEEAQPGRHERGPAPEAWALPSRPFMLRRDRHAPRWNQSRGIVPVTSAPIEPDMAQAAILPAAPITRPVPIEAGPPPVPEPVAAAASMNIEADVTVAAAPEAPQAMQAEARPEVQAEPPLAAPAELPLAVQAEPAPAVQAELPWAAVPPTASEPSPVPANDAVAGPAIQPIVIGTEAAPPAERKRGWWRRR